MALSDFIKKKRMGAFLTQQEAAKLLGYSRSQFLSNMERGNRKPPLEVLQKMCEIYKVPEEEMREEYVKQVTQDAHDSAHQKWDNSRAEAKKLSLKAK
ncbi:helix-turn-helix domain-containing protein [Bdellovibrio sp. SKB1291214]|uniref:helix-turn-helix domain-containing protein n=1 Tax=Bdellovibrio sp. SKB1291214 TaxID=1732569 RepID=UPI000B51CCE3|nr:helix-turn-helix transcriptional regulator [Bdellovibrio sp. SKB1291214]UYL09103.1 helix-turn-helix domain-containing protein [Bdellovibrio sp. SKB1291214]